MRSSVTGLQFRILEISVSDISERPTLVNAAQMPTESSRANVTFLRSNIKYFGVVEQRNEWTIGPYEMEGIVMYSLDGDDRIKEKSSVAGSRVRWSKYTDVSDTNSTSVIRVLILNSVTTILKFLIHYCFLKPL